MRVNKNTPFQVLGRTRGGEWLYVESEAKKMGWLYTSFVESNQDLLAPPIIEPKQVQLVKGQVVDDQLQPVSGIQFTLQQGSGASMMRNSAVTDNTGTFYAYMPLRAKGTWLLSYSATTCQSNMMDNNCQCKSGLCGKTDPLVMNVVLPQKKDFVFGWK
jgi:hypothetical protein